MRHLVRQQRLRRLLLLSVLALGVFVTLWPGGTPQFAQAATATYVVISEVQIGGDAPVVGDDEFVELYNPTSSVISLNGWRLTRKTSGGTETNLVASFSSATVIQPQSYLLIAPTTYNGSPTADVSYSFTTNRIAANNTILLYDNTSVLIDKVGFGTAGDFETTVFSSNPSNNDSIERKPGASDPLNGNGDDTNDNSADFQHRTTSEPQNSSSSIEPANTVTPSPTESLTPTDTQTPSETPTPSDTPTPTETATNTDTPTDTLTPTDTFTPAPEIIVINEVVTDPQQDWNDTAGGNVIQFDS